MRVGGIGSVGRLGQFARRPTAIAAPFVGVLDLIGVPSSGAYSEARRLTVNHTFALIRVRRSSDNAEQDFGYTSDGGLDSASLLAFVGGGIGFVVTRYDQSGTGRHVTQTNPTLQPRIVNAGVLETFGGRPAMRVFGGMRLQTVNARQLPFTYTAVGCVMPTDIGGSNKMWLGGSGGQYIKIGAIAANDFWRLSATSLTGPLTYVNNIPTVRSLILNSTTLRGWTDGNPAVSNLNVAPTAQNFQLWLGTTVDGNAWIGSIGDVLLFDVALTDTQRQTAERNIGAYYGVPIT